MLLNMYKNLHNRSIVKLTLRLTFEKNKNKKPGGLVNLKEGWTRDT